MRQQRRGDAGPGDEAGGVSTLTAPGQSAPPRGSRRRYDPAWEDWRRPRRWPGILLTCAVVLAFIGIVAWHYRPMSAPHASNPIRHAGKPELAYVPLVTGRGAAIRTFHGSRTAVGLRFATNGRLLVMAAECACSYNFVVSVQNSLGAPVAIPVSATGPFDGSMNVQLPAGTYTMNVIAPSPAVWTVRLIQPGPNPPVVVTPFKYFSLHQSVLGPFSASNRFLYFKFFSTTNQTARVFVVDTDGSHVEQAFVGRSLISSPRTLPNPPSPYYVEVDASGYWQLRVQRSARG